MKCKHLYFIILDKIIILQNMLDSKTAKNPKHKSEKVFQIWDWYHKKLAFRKVVFAKSLHCDTRLKCG